MEGRVLRSGTESEAELSFGFGGAAGGGEGGGVGDGGVGGKGVFAGLKESGCLGVVLELSVGDA